MVTFLKEIKERMEGNNIKADSYSDAMGDKIPSTQEKRNYVASIKMVLITYLLQ